MADCSFPIFSTRIQARHSWGPSDPQPRNARDGRGGPIGVTVQQTKQFQELGAEIGVDVRISRGPRCFTPWAKSARRAAKIGTGEGAEVVPKIVNRPFPTASRGALTPGKAPQRRAKQGLQVAVCLCQTHATGRRSGHITTCDWKLVAGFFPP